MADFEYSSREKPLIPYHDEGKHPDISLLPNKLCDELVEEILLRLPTTSAVKFKVVCKKWYSLISSSSFISHFIHMRRHRHVQSSIIFQFAYECDDTCDPDDCKQCHSEFQIISEYSLLHNLYGEGEFQLSYLPCPPKDLVLEGSFADLILCSYHLIYSMEKNYYVCNLLTRQWIALPPAPTNADFMEPVSIGFLCSERKPAHSCSHNNFMVVRLCSHDSNVLLSQFKVQVFSSEEDHKWRTFVVSSSLPLEPYIVDTPLVAYRGMLHWLNASSDCIVVYDPLNNPTTSSRIIHFPIELPFSFHRYGCFGVSQGRLRVVIISDKVLHLWELEEYDSGLWNLAYEFHLNNLICKELPESEIYSVYALSLHPENGDTIYLEILDGVALVNMKSRTIERYYPPKENVSYKWMKAFHLADQWWPTEISSLHTLSVDKQVSLE